MRLAAEDACSNQLDDAGNRIYRPATASATPSRAAQLAAVPPLAMRFPATDNVASLAMVRASRRLPPPTQHRANASSAHGNVTCDVSRGGTPSRRCVADGRGRGSEKRRRKTNRDGDAARRLSAPSLFVVCFSLQFSYLPLAMVRRSGPSRGGCAKCAWKRHAGVSRGGASPAACRRRSGSRFFYPGCGLHAFRCVSGCAVRPVARDGLREQPPRRLEFMQ